MKNLCVDIGNTRCKIALFESKKIVDQAVYNNTQEDDILNFIRHQTFEKSMVSNVHHEHTGIISYLKANSKLVFPDISKPLPFASNYKLENLGQDRLAAIAGAQEMFSVKPALIINTGTCITLDVLVDNIHIGGNISPGMRMRWKAMDSFTARLPLVSQDQITSDFLGLTTESALANGVLQGILGEIGHYYCELYSKYPDLNCVLTGGDAEFLVKRLSFQTFAEPNLVLFGLNNILNYQ